MERAHGVHGLGEVAGDRGSALVQVEEVELVEEEEEEEKGAGTG